MNASECMAAIKEAIHYQIRNGVITENRLARRCAISQPYTHLIMAGKRPLPPHIADCYLIALKLDAAEIIQAEHQARQLARFPLRRVA